MPQSHHQSRGPLGTQSFRKPINQWTRIKQPKKMRLWQYLCNLRGSEAILGVSKLEGENHSEAAGLCESMKVMESMTIISTFNYHGPMAVYGSLFALETLYPVITPSILLTVPCAK